MPLTSCTEEVRRPSYPGLALLVETAGLVIRMVLHTIKVRAVPVAGSCHVLEPLWTFRA